MNLADGDGVQVVQPLPAHFAAGDEVGFAQHAQVLHHAEAGHRRQGPAQLAQGLAIALEQSVEQHPAATVGEGTEDGVVLGLGDRSGEHSSIM